MKIGFERQNTFMICPSAIGARSTSIGAPAAMVEASGFICAISGTNTAAAPTAPTAPVAIYRKSRRVCSAEDTVVTSWALSSGWLRLPPAAGARDRSLAAGRGRTGCGSPGKGRTARRWRSIGTLAVQAQARKSAAGKAEHRFCARPRLKCYNDLPIRGDQPTAHAGCLLGPDLRGLA